MFSFHHWFSLLFSGVFIFDYLWSLHHCFFRCFYFTTDFIIVFQVFSFHQLSSPGLFFVSTSFLCSFTMSAMDLRGIFYSQVFFTLHSFLTFNTNCIYWRFPGADSSTLKVVGPPTEFRNTDLVHLFVWITQCSAKGISQ